MVYSVMVQQNSWEQGIFEGENVLLLFLEVVTSKVESLRLVVSALGWKAEEEETMKGSWASLHQDFHKKTVFSL